MAQTIRPGRCTRFARARPWQFVNALCCRFFVKTKTQLVPVYHTTIDATLAAQRAAGPGQAPRQGADTDERADAAGN